MSFVLPVLADRRIDRRRRVVAVVGCTVLGAAWFLAVPGLLPWVATTLLGLGLGGGFSLGLVHVVEYAVDAGASSRLTAMVFLLCYTAAAIAPVAVGGLRDLTGGFTAGFALLLVISLVQLGLSTRLGAAYRGTVA